jgi:WD40 repeat protein
MNATPAVEPQKTHLAGEFKYTSPLLSCRFDPSGQFVFATAYDNSIQRWNLASGKATPFLAHDSWVRALAFHPSGGTCYSGGYDGRLIWWETSSEAPQPLRTVEAHDGWLRAIAVSPDGKLLATCGNDNLVKLWNALDGTPLGECFGHANHVYNVAFHPLLPLLVSGDLKGVVREWDVNTCEQLRQFSAATLWKYDAGFGADIGGVRGMDFSRDGKLLACGGITEVSNAFAGIGHPLAVVINLEKGEPQQQHVTAAKLKGPIWNVRYHRDGFLIGASGGHDGGHVLFWKLDQPTEFFDFKLPDICRDFDLHPDQVRLATSHEDKSLRVWQMTAKA